MTTPVTKDMNVILAVAHMGYQQTEYFTTKKELEDHGVRVVTASTKLGNAIAKDEKSVAHVDILIDKIDMKDYDGIFLIGGPGAMDALDTPAVHHLISQAKKLKLPFGAICVSVRILAKAGALKGHEATGWDGDHALKGILEGYGATYKTKNHVVVDDHIVTATGPSAAHDFGRGILQLLRERKLSPHHHKKG